MDPSILPRIAASRLSVSADERLLLKPGRHAIGGHITLHGTAIVSPGVLKHRHARVDPWAVVLRLMNRLQSVEDPDGAFHSAIDAEVDSPMPSEAVELLKRAAGLHMDQLVKPAIIEEAGPVDCQVVAYWNERDLPPIRL